MLRYNVVVFDLDKTLVYTDFDYRRAVARRALNQLGVSASQEDIDAFLTLDERDRVIYERFGVSPAYYWKVYNGCNYFELRIKNTMVYPDVGVLRMLRELGCRLGIVTAAPKVVSDAELSVLGFDFDAVINVDYQNRRGLKPKPHPEGLDFCLGEMGVDKNRVLYGGDLSGDVEMALQAGVDSFLIYRDSRSYPGPQPTYRLKSLFELVPIVCVGEQCNISMLEQRVELQ